MTFNLVEGDFLKWLRGDMWMYDCGYLPKFHAAIGDTPYFLASIIKRFGSKGAAPAQFGKDGAFKRQSRGFMEKDWDGFDDVWAYQAWVTEWASLMRNFVYPGAVIAFFGGSRTYHRVASGLEDAGWEVFDCIQYMYGTGFPKAADIGDLLEKSGEDSAIADVYRGFKTYLKPSYEPIVLARAPRDGLTFAQMAAQFNSGALNIDAARIPTSDELTAGGSLVTSAADERDGAALGMFQAGTENTYEQNQYGRYPSNTVLGCACEGDRHDPDCPVEMLNQQSGMERRAGGNLSGKEPADPTSGIVYNGGYNRHTWNSYADNGGASRFFYTTKATTWEKEAGLEDFEGRRVSDLRKYDIDNAYLRGKTVRKNVHPTVKSIQLTTWLASLLLPPAYGQERRILIPFSGSGSEIIGAHLAGWDSITGIERESEYMAIARARVEWWGKFASFEEAKTVYDAHLQDEKQADAGQLKMF